MAAHRIGGLVPTYFYYICEKSAPFAQHVLKPEIMDVSCGKIKINMKYEPYMSGSPQPECMHGGAIAAAIDHVGGMCAISALPSMYKILSTVNLRVDYLNPLSISEGGIIST
jgi:acyl-coenzyme A thioesterase PaaI-like protein